MNKEEFISEFTSRLRELDVRKVDTEELMKLKYENLPKTLFKYCSFDENNRNVNNLKKDIVWMNNPKNFNDPYEFTFSINTDKVIEQKYEKKTKLFLEVCEKDFSNEDIEKIKLDSNSFDVVINNLLKEGKFTQDKLDKFEEKYIGVTQQYIDNFDIRKFFKVSSFAEENDLLLMWSHYAQNHTGFCIEYDIDSLGFDSKVTQLLYPIVYSEEIFDITDFYLNENDEHSHIDYLLEGMLRKSSEWEYEKEWRLITVNEDEFGTECAMPKPKSIFLGSQFDADNLKKLYNFCSDHKINLYHMKLDKLEYKLTPHVLKKF